MSKREDVAARERRQERVTKVVWGLLLITAGVLFTLDNLGKIELTVGRQFAPASAVDGDPATRWSSEFRDPQWITVDLGAATDITGVKLNWEAAHAKAYQLQVSNDGSSWTTVRDVTGADGGIDDLDVSARARYVRMFGTSRATPYGYSLWEFEVHGAPTPAKTATASSIERVDPWPMYWPVLLIAAGIPSLVAPKDSGNQVVGLLLTGMGAALQLRHLGLVSWGYKGAGAALLIVGGLILVICAWRQMDGGEAKPDGGSGGAESFS
jgi:hypothetical protein